MKKVKVTENNGGGITLYAVDIYGQEYAHDGYEYNPAQLLKDVFAILIEDADTSDWDGNDLTNPEIIRQVRGYYDSEDVDVDTPLTLNEYEDNHPTTKTIVEGNDDSVIIRYTRLGNAGASAILP